MTAQIIDGQQIAHNILQQMKEQIAMLSPKPRLDIVLVGNDEASVIYVRKKMQAATEIGMIANLHLLDENSDNEQILSLIDCLNNNPECNGIIVQLPLPPQLDTTAIINRINPRKDVDGFNPYNTGLLQNNEKPYFIAATPLGIMELIKTQCTELSGKNVVIIGASIIVGRPLATLMLNQECTVSITHIHTRNIQEFTAKADILIAACGVANLVKKEWIKPNAILIDVGINRDNGKLCGDIDFADVKEKAGAITPVPKGVGPMTVAMLLRNTLDAYLLQKSVL